MIGVRTGRLTELCVTLLAGSDRTNLRAAPLGWSLDGTTLSGTFAIVLGLGLGLVVVLVLDSLAGGVAATGGATTLEWTGPWILLAHHNREWVLRLRGPYQEPCSCQGRAFQSCSRRKQGHQGHQSVIWFSLSRLDVF